MKSQEEIQTIKVTMGQLVTAMGSFRALGQEKMGVRAAIDYKRIWRKAVEEVDAFYQVKDQIFERYVVKDEEGNVQFEEDQKTPKFTDKEAADKELKELMEADVDLGVRGIPASRLEGVKVSPADLEMMEAFILEDA